MKPALTQKYQISYRWIENSCRENKLLPTEGYQIGGPSGIAVPVRRSSAANRSVRRLEFSKEDDDILLAAVNKQITLGGAVNGNKLYDAIAAVVRSFCAVVQGVDCSILNIHLSRGGIDGSKPCLNDITSSVVRATIRRPLQRPRQANKVRILLHQGRQRRNLRDNTMQSFSTR